MVKIDIKQLKAIPGKLSSKAESILKSKIKSKSIVKKDKRMTFKLTNPKQVEVEATLIKKEGIRNTNFLFN